MVKRIGIITYTNTNNYGARLQAVALTKLFEDKGYKVEIINVDYPKRYIKYVLGRIINKSESFSEWIMKYLISYKMIRFSKKNLKKTKHIVSSSTEKMVRFINNQKYDAVICGSDEIWSCRTKEIAPPSIYFLPAEINTKKIAFAPSANGNHFFSDKEKIWLEKSLNEFIALGLRDKKTYNLVDGIVEEKEKFLIYDPTILYDFNDIGVNRKINKKKKKICFVLARPYDKVPDKIMSKLGNKDYVFFSMFNKVKNTIFLPSSPEEFVFAFKEFDYVYTNLFHATIFCIKNNTNFFAFDTFKKYKENQSKIEDLLSRIGLENNFFSLIDDNKNELIIEEIADRTKNIIGQNKKNEYQEKLNKPKKELEEYINYVDSLIDV